MFLGAVEAAEMNSFEISKAISLSLNTHHYNTKVF
jgi:hypothetical protein